VPFLRKITDVTGMPPHKRNGDMFVGYSGLAALRMEQCNKITETAVAGQQLGEHGFATTITTEELLGHC
jgi:hypothetical protein